MVEDEADYSDLCSDVVLTRAEHRCNSSGMSEEKDGQTPMKHCKGAQSDAIDEVQLNIDNDEFLYNNYPSSSHSARDNDAIKNGVEQGYRSCESAFHPNAEEEIDELRKPTGDRAMDIANSLFRPFKEQFVEIPKPKRERWNKQCRQSVRGAVVDYDICVRRKFKKPS